MVKIPDKKLKKIWGKSGGLCAICKNDLFKGGSNIGEVCHHCRWDRFLGIPQVAETPWIVKII